jgi:hypothetical protein
MPAKRLAWKPRKLPKKRGGPFATLRKKFGCRA